MEDIITKAVDLMAEEAALVINKQKRIIREQEVEIRVYRFLTILFLCISVAAAITLLFA